MVTVAIAKFNAKFGAKARQHCMYHYHFDNLTGLLPVC